MCVCTYNLCVNFQFLHPPSFDCTTFLKLVLKTAMECIRGAGVRCHPSPQDIAFRLLLDSSVHYYRDYTSHPKQHHSDQGQLKKNL